MKGENAMTNFELLEEEIKKSGKKKTYLAKKAGMSYASFRNCCLNKQEFRTSQVKILCDELNITNPETKQAIFFA